MHKKKDASNLKEVYVGFMMENYCRKKGIYYFSTFAYIIL